MVLTALTDEEERLFGTADRAGWLGAPGLPDRGAQHSGGPAYQRVVVRGSRSIEVLLRPRADLLIVPAIVLEEVHSARQ